MATADEAAAARRARLPDQASIVGQGEFTSRRGNKYTIIKTSELDAYERPLAAEELATAGAARLKPGDDFAGTDRRDAKLSIVNAKTEQFDDLQKLLASLTPDNKMEAHQPPLKEDASFQRVKEEQRNVRVRAFLYAASRETDNDFHFIVGRDPKSPPAYMNMELSGLPPKASPTFARLDAARSAYKTFVQNQLPGPGYHHYDPPIPIDVEGSLFFDITHAHGTHPGPAKIRPATIWEVHPISHIVFEPT
jgi:hypothetical protein